MISFQKYYKMFSSYLSSSQVLYSLSLRGSIKVQLTPHSNSKQNQLNRQFFILFIEKKSFKLEYFHVRREFIKENKNSLY